MAAEHWKNEEAGWVTATVPVGMAKLNSLSSTLGGDGKPSETALFSAPLLVGQGCLSRPRGITGEAAGPASYQWLHQRIHKR